MLGCMRASTGSASTPSRTAARRTRRPRRTLRSRRGASRARTRRTGERERERGFSFIPDPRAQAGLRNASLLAPGRRPRLHAPTVAPPRRRASCGPGACACACRPRAREPDDAVQRDARAARTAPRPGAARRAPPLGESAATRLYSRCARTSLRARGRNARAAAVLRGALRGELRALGLGEPRGRGLGRGRGQLAQREQQPAAPRRRRDRLGRARLADGHVPRHRRTAHAARRRRRPHNMLTQCGACSAGRLLTSEKSSGGSCATRSSSSRKSRSHSACVCVCVRVWHVCAVCVGVCVCAAVQCVQSVCVCVCEWCVRVCV